MQFSKITKPLLTCQIIGNSTFNIVNLRSQLGFSNWERWDASWRSFSSLQKSYHCRKVVADRKTLLNFPLIGVWVRLWWQNITISSAWEDIAPHVKIYKGSLDLKVLGNVINSNVRHRQAFGCFGEKKLDKKWQCNYTETWCSMQRSILLLPLE